MTTTRTQWTVVGMYDDEGFIITWQVTASDPHEAMATAAADCEGSESLVIIGAVPGWHDITPACEDSGKSAYAVDLVPEQQPHVVS